MINDSKKLMDSKPARKKTIGISLALVFVSLLVIYLYPNILTLLIFITVPIIALITLLIIELARKNLRQTKWKPFLAALLLTAFLTIPVTWAGIKTGPTLGFQIPFSKTLWGAGWHLTVRYYMAEDLTAAIKLNNYSKQDILKMLGKPDWEFSNSWHYELKPDGLTGLGLYTLTIDFKGDIADTAAVHYSD